MPISLPKFLLKPFADTGAKADIPVASDQPAGRAGYDVGFPPINMTPVAAGGIPPFGQDMNGILFDLSKAIQYTQSGVHFPFDSAFATSIGGYPIGAIVSDASDNSILWINGTLNNTAYPTGWTQTGIKQATETILGTAKIATQAKVNAGTDDYDFITSKKLKDGGFWPIGIGQTWQDFSSSRVTNVNYTNSTGRSIVVTVVTTGSAGCGLVVNGLVVSESTIPVPSANNTVSAIVPPGGVYRQVGSTSITFWRELR